MGKIFAQQLQAKISNNTEKKNTRDSMRNGFDLKVQRIPSWGSIQRTLHVYVKGRGEHSWKTLRKLGPRTDSKFGRRF